MTKRGKWLRIGVLVGSLLCFIVNVDVAISVGIIQYKYPVIPIFLVGALIGNLKLYYTFYCMTLFGNDVVGVGEKWRQKRYMRFLLIGAAWGLGAMHPSAERIHRWQKRGRFGIFVLGAMPVPGIRNVGLVLARMHNDAVSLFVLAWGNFFRFAYIAWVAYGIAWAMSN